MNKEQYIQTAFQKVDDKPDQVLKDKINSQLFWFSYVPTAAVLAFFIALVNQSGGVFFPAFGVCLIVIGSIGSSWRENGGN